jgi:hypothetical protein
MRNIGRVARRMMDDLKARNVAMSRRRWVGKRGRMRIITTLREWRPE